MHRDNNVCDNAYNNKHNLCNLFLEMYKIQIIM